MDIAVRPLSGQVAVVTGGASGLGLGFAHVLGRAGARLVLASLPGSGVAETVARLKDSGIDAVGAELDVGDLGAVEALRDQAFDLGGLDIWVNNAGAPGVYGPAHLTPADTFERVLNANIRGVFHGTRTAVAAMLERGSGHVVNVWGKGATKPVALQSAYASSKAWNRAYTRTVRAELADTGVSVHGYDPGLVKTEMLGRVQITPGMEKKVAALPWVVSLWGQTPDEAAAPILRLLLEDRTDHRDLTAATVVRRGARSVVRGNLRRSRRMTLQIETVGPTG